MNRLTSSTVSLSPTPLVKTFTYDTIGNLLTKSDVGTYTYPAAGSPRPHGVVSIAGGTLNATFTEACPRVGEAAARRGLEGVWGSDPAPRRLFLS